PQAGRRTGVPHPAGAPLVWRHGGVDIVAIERIAGFEPQGVTRAEAARLRPPGTDEGEPERFQVGRAAIQLEPVFSGVAGARDEALYPRDLPLRAVVVGNHRDPHRREL